MAPGVHRKLKWKQMVMANAAAACVVCLPGPLAAATYIVTGTLDGPGVISGGPAIFQATTMRGAVIAANNAPGPDTVVLKAGETYALSVGPSDSGLADIVPQSGDLDITNDLEIYGNGATVDAAGIDRAFDIQSPPLSALKVTIRNLQITGGRPKGLLSPGGAVSVRACTLEMIGCTLRGNSTDDGASTDNGGALAANKAGYPAGVPAVVTLTSCRLISNTGLNGGAVVASGSTFTAERCEFAGNTALGGPGGAAVFAVGTTSTISLTNCTFRDGQVLETAGVVGGGAVSSFYANPRLANCTATANSAPKGGAIFCWGSPPEVLNSVLWGNVATYGGEINSFQPSGNPAVSYSCVAGGIAGTGNISDDPLIINAATGNLGLLAGSPAIDSGAESGFPEVDILGSSRPVDGDLNGQAGCDMGAYEVRTVTLQQARLAPTGSFVNTDAGIISRTFDGYFYAERTDRAAGIRVDKTEHLLEPGQRVRVAGIVGTTSDGEKHILAQGVSAYGFEEVRPLGMAQRALGGGDWHYDPVSLTGQQGVEGGSGLNNIGLMVRLWGTVSHVGFGFFCLDDGSGVADPDGHRGVRVLALWDPLPGVGRQVEVTGISSCTRQDGRLFRLLRAAFPEDVHIMDPVLSVPPGFVLSNGKRVIGNLLVNAGAEIAALSGWSIITVSGSDGWTTRGGGAEGARAFLTSYNWCKRSQTVDLGAAGFSAEEMDSIPAIVVSESYQGSWPNYADSYYLFARLNSPSATLSEYNSGVLKAGTVWQQAETAFTEYPAGARSIYVEDGGDDAEYWAGHYGTAIDAASVVVQPWEPVRVMNMDDADVLEISISVQSGAISLAHTANVTFTVGDGAADAHMTFSGAVRALNSVLGSLTYTGAGSADVIRIAVSRPGSQSPLEVREIPVMAPG